MHPMERLRSVARATGVGPTLLAREAAGALASLGPDPAGLVTACRRLVDRHPTVGPLWWLSSRVLCAPEAAAEAWRSSAEIDADTTAAALAAALPDAATVVLVGWGEQATEAVRRRGDADVLLVSGGGAAGPSRHLRAAGVAVADVADAGLGAAVAGAGLVVLESVAMGPERFLAPSGSRAAAAVARTAGVPVWVVAGVGRVVPARLWAALEARVARTAGPPWERPEEMVPLALCDRVVGPAGLRESFGHAHDPGCPVAPELLKPMV